jgi:S-adenosyl-L-methionine hydrolase (adenosine-forming)
MTARPITFLSDYGTADHFVGVCHAVIAGICPQARVIDLTHGIPRHGVRAGALILRASLRYLPIGVHLAVVDPGVGGSRRAVALRTSEGRLLVGPDNGLLSLAGPVSEAVDIAGSPVRLEPVSATFHGRDRFAPVAAHLAAGASLADLGAPCDPAGLVTIELPRPRYENDVIVAHALYVDGFGNVALDLGAEALEPLGIRPGRVVEVRSASGRTGASKFVRTFADAGPGELILYEDSDGALALAVNQGDAAERLALRVDGELRLVVR